MIQYTGSATAEVVNLKLFGDDVSTAIDVDLKKSPFNLNFYGNIPTSMVADIAASESHSMPTVTLLGNGILHCEFPTPLPSRAERLSPRCEMTVFLIYGGGMPKSKKTVR